MHVSSLVATCVKVAESSADTKIVERVSGNQRALTTRAQSASQFLGAFARFRYPTLAIVAVVTAWQVDGSCICGDWGYFVRGSSLLFGSTTNGPPGGLHLYANYPEIQIGPLSLVVAAGLRSIAGGSGQVPAELLMGILGLAVVLLLERAARRIRGTSDVTEWSLVLFTILTGGLLFLRAWSKAAGAMAHLDDILTLTAVAVAVWAVAAKKPFVVGLAIGMAAAAKPWGIFFLPLALALERRQAARALTSAIAVTCAAWLPFVIADTGTLSASRYGINNNPASVLHLLGVEAAKSPHWVRPTQLVLALAIGCFAIARRRWAAIVVLAVAARLIVDPGVFDYYAVGLVLGAFIWDLIGSRYPLPILTLLAFMLLQANGPLVGGDPHHQAVARLTVLLLVVAGALILPRLDSASPTAASNTTKRAKVNVTRSMNQLVNDASLAFRVQPSRPGSTNVPADRDSGPTGARYDVVS